MVPGKCAAPSAINALALLLSQEPGTPADNGALLARAAALVPAVLHAGGGWLALQLIAVQARNAALAPDSSPDIRRAALEYLQALERPELAQALVAEALKMGTVTPAMESLLPIPGAASIWIVAQNLVAFPGNQVMERLRQLTTLLDRGVWKAAAEQAENFAEDQVIAFLTLAARMPKEIALESSQILASHPSPQVRKLAMAHLAFKDLTQYQTVGETR